MQNVLHKRFNLHAYKLQLRHELEVVGRPKRVEFATIMLNEIEVDDEL